MFRNVSVTDADAVLSRDAYAMSHLSAVNLACTYGLVGRVDARAAAATVQPYLRGGGVPARARHWQWSSLLNVNDDHKLRVN